MSHRNVVSWTSLMSGYVNTNQPYKAISLFGLMYFQETPPNSYTFATVINACSHLAKFNLGQQIHAQIEIYGLGCDTVVCTALIDMYGKSDGVLYARKVFDKMADKNVISWGSIISVYAQNACCLEAIEIFNEFLQIGVPNQFIFSSVVNACASIGKLGLGRPIHGKIIKHGHESNDFICGALIDMYAKCGSFDDSKKVFDKIKRPSIIEYTSMIISGAIYGLTKYALNLFNQMISQKQSPNSVTLLAVLHACSHAGLVNTGIYHLTSMKSLYNINPSAKHYTCVVDMLGRAGRLDEAYNLTKSVRAEGQDKLMIWSTLMSACWTHKRLDLVAEAGERVKEFERDVGGAMVVMSSAYFSAGEWKNAESVRCEMRKKGIKKEVGCSWVD
ncbi:hypothetical protein LUZ60_002297 [Juncus effusus]|nr:hypothetical protein LUZ60_002297 [Juncus effusus]